MKKYKRKTNTKEKDDEKTKEKQKKHICNICRQKKMIFKMIMKKKKKSRQRKLKIRKEENQKKKFSINETECQMTRHFLIFAFINILLVIWMAAMF